MGRRTSVGRTIGAVARGDRSRVLVVRRGVGAGGCGVGADRTGAGSMSGGSSPAGGCAGGGVGATGGGDGATAAAGGALAGRVVSESLATSSPLGGAGWSPGGEAVWLDDEERVSA